MKRKIVLLATTEGGTESCQLKSGGFSHGDKFEYDKILNIKIHIITNIKIYLIYFYPNAIYIYRIKILNLKNDSINQLHNFIEKDIM